MNVKAGYKIIGVDPGTTHTAFAVYDQSTKQVTRAGHSPNGLALIAIDCAGADILAIEQIKSYGMPMGDSTIETCYLIGRLMQLWGIWRPTVLLPRKTIVTTLCNSPRGNDATLRQAIIDRFGGSRLKAIGKKDTPGPLYGVTGDMWSAIGVALCLDDLMRLELEGVPTHLAKTYQLSHILRK